MTVPITEAMQMTVSSEIENRIDASRSSSSRATLARGTLPAVADMVSLMRGLSVSPAAPKSKAGHDRPLTGGRE